MSKIDKLSILGVRSFDNIRSETIQFNTPLTLIVGYNGSGKTTIIECLKYATTGELPPNSKTGGAFIHDPKLCGEKEVLAQVKLSFRSTSGARMVATRSLQLTVKKATRSQKTLEGQLLMIKDGERTAISSRVAELDQILPQYLGVSKAILENVIFCHQDDSLWPMSEPSVLKKKFDEIFEAMKYTKAIENIKILRKRQNEELGKLKIIEQNAKADKDKGDRVEKRSTELFDEIEALRTQYQDVKAQAEAAQKQSAEAYGHAAKYEQDIERLKAKRAKLESDRENLAYLQTHLKEMAETDDELQTILDQYEERIALYHEQRQTLREQYQDHSNQLDENRRALSQKQTEIGKYEAEKAQHEHQVRKREGLVKDAANRHAIRGFDLDITDKKVSEFLQILSKMSRDQAKALDRARQEAQEELRQAQAVLNQLNERKSELNQSRNSARAQIEKNDRQVAIIQSRMDNIAIDEGGEAVLVEKQTDIESKLKKATDDFEKSRLDDQIRDAESRLRSLDERKEHLDAELVEATRSARDTAQIEYAQGQLKETRRSLETMTGAHGPRIAAAVGSDWRPESLDSAFQAVSSRKASAVKDAETRRDLIMSKLDKTNFRLSTLDSELQKKTKEAKQSENLVKKALNEEDISDFEAILQEREEEYELVSSDQAKFQASLEYFESCLKTAREKNCCRLCSRALRDDKAQDFTKAKFLSKIESLIQKGRAQANQDNPEEKLADLEEVRKAKPSFDLWNRLNQQELPALRKELQDLASERDTINAELEQQDSAVEDLRSSKQEVDSLAKNVQAIVNYFNETQALERKIQDLAEHQRAAGVSRSIESVQDDLKKINEESRKVKAALTRFQQDRERLKTQINSLQLKIRDIAAELGSARSQLKEKRELAERIAEFKSQNAEQKDAIRGFDRDIQLIVPQIEQAQLKYDDAMRRGNERIDHLQQTSSRVADTLRQLQDADKEINAYIDKGGPQQLARTHREIENGQAEISRIEEELRQITVQVKKVDDNLRNTDDTKRGIHDNLNYRRTKRNLHSLQAEIEELEDRNAEADQERWAQEGQDWQREWNKLSAQENSLHGTLSTKDAQLKELIEEWETEYKDAAYKYREAHIKVETTKAAVEDLGRYGGALDKAIMKYHTLKMEEINRIIEELWKKTYQGTDVDTIMIRSDNETAKGNRSYNYRVVMSKQDAEMDMRGRCSAGQKVLASIIIRLALAECFGVNCGLIALDEPTTNLDSNNIVALASSLAEIIKIRRKQANFQLIVITHDEEFLKNMQCADFCDTYWRVMRNEKQKSIITRQSIHEVAR